MRISLTILLCAMLAGCVAPKSKVRSQKSVPMPPSPFAVSSLNRASSETVAQGLSVAPPTFVMPPIVIPLSWPDGLLLNPTKFSVEATSDFTTWTSVPCSLDGDDLVFSDPEYGRATQRFYRVKGER